ncbi:Serpin domain containing protein [Asbolus verrucosus]|uniref:Serpin domain containing protein n=1 Tax=Asbolus verrucosus TaxID=1661398 RepID=A0A482W9U9_ASBVE|nr:Serpin domain containing protein [Asbolus verrucosus]
MELEIAALLALILAWTHGATLEEFTNGNNLFAADIYKEVIKTNNENVLISPLSAEIVFAMAQSGAKGKTGEEIRTSLHLPNTDEETQLVVKSVLPTLNGNGSFQLYSANKMYVTDKFPVKEEFKQVATKVYQADLENVDFGHNVETADNINKWVEKQTQNKIHNLIESDMLDDRTVAILLNALYFKAKWNTHFDVSLTKKENFYKTAGDVTEVDFMHVYDENYNYYESEELNAKFLEIPFQGEDLSMVFVLPNEKTGLAALENRVEKVFGQHNFAGTLLNVTIPKLKIGSTTDLRQVLENLGVKKAFSPNKADFTGAIDLKGFYINEAKQKTFIDVDEQGVEAAAISYIGWHFLSEPPKAIKEFVADHPFIFYIKLKNFILFAGRVLTPEQ